MSRSGNTKTTQEHRSEQSRRMERVKKLFLGQSKKYLFPVAKVKKIRVGRSAKKFLGVKLFGHKYTDVLQTASRQMPTAQRMASSLETRP